MKKNLLISACLLGVGCRYDGGRVKKIDINNLKQYFNLVPVCPEILGGLPTPRTPSERIGDRVMMRDGTDVTENYHRGADESYEIASALDCEVALLKAKSPSCGKGKIYDGTFSGILKDGDGVTAELLLSRGIRVYTEDEISLLIERES